MSCTASNCPVQSLSYEQDTGHLCPLFNTVGEADHKIPDGPPRDCYAEAIVFILRVVALGIMEALVKELNVF